MIKINKIQTKTLILLTLLVMAFSSSCSSSKKDTTTPPPVELSTAPSESEPSQPTATPVPEPIYDIPDFKSLDEIKQLKEKNSDFVFWFYLPSETIEPFNYPVMQTPNDKFYYIDKDFDKNPSKAGTLFLDYRNNAETLEGHTIVYGHNQSDGSMFGNLLKYYQDENGRPLKDPNNDKFFKEHQYFYTYSPTLGKSIWQIFSIYETTTDELYIKTDFATSLRYYRFISDLQNKSFFKTDVELTQDSDVMTLSTCYKFSHENGRLIVNAVRLETQELK